MPNWIKTFIDLFSRETVTFQLKQLRGLKLVNKTQSIWSVLDDDPQFSLRHRFRKRLPPGCYRIKIIRGEYIYRLRSAALYFDTGSGFNEAERQDIRFIEEAGTFVGYVAVGPKVRRLRFDPVENGRLTFAARKIGFERIETDKFQAALTRSTSPGQPPLQRPKSPEKLSILINLFRLLPAHKGAGGAGRLALAYLRYLPELFNVRVIITENNEELIPEFPRIDFALCKSESLAEFSEHLDWCDCYFDFLNGLRPTYIPDNVVVLVCLLDLQHMRFPMLFSQAELDTRQKEYGYAIDRADRLIAISQYECGNLRDFYSRTNVSVVPLSGFAAEEYIQSNGFSFIQKENLRTYLVYPAVPWAHKNHETLIQAIAVLKKTGRSVRLILTNTEANQSNKDRLKRLCQKFNLENEIEFTGFLSEVELIALMQKSSGLVFPSLYEGFGIPLADAMRLGVPILASNIAAIFELCGESASYFSNHRNAISMAEDIWRFWSGSEARRANIAAGKKRGELFSSKRMAEGVLDAAQIAVAERQTSSAGLRLSKPTRPERTLLSVLIILRAQDVLPENFSSAAIRSILLQFGESIDVTFAVDIASLNIQAVANSLIFVPNLIIFDDNSNESRAAAVEEFARRYSNSEFQIALEWADLDKFSVAQLNAMLHGLRINPTAQYAIVNSEIFDVFFDTSSSEVSSIMKFDDLRGANPIILGAMLRCDDAFREVKNGTLRFLSAYSLVESIVQVPLVGAYDREASKA